MINLKSMTREECVLVIEDLYTAMKSNYQETLEKKNDEFDSGRQLAYFETLDMLVSRVIVNGGEAEEVTTPG